MKTSNAGVGRARVSDAADATIPDDSVIHVDGAVARSCDGPPASAPCLHPFCKASSPKVGTTVFSVMSALAVKHEAINLGQGFPDFDCDPRLVEAVADAMRSGHNQYPLMPGVPLLRERVAAKVEAMHGVRYDPASEITITAGATQGILSCILAVARPGDEVIVLEPCYDSYIPNIELAGARAVPIPLRRGTSIPILMPSPQRLDRQRGQSSSIRRTTLRTDVGAADWQRLAEIIGGRDIWVISDEVYEHMVFDGVPHISAARHPAAARAYLRRVLVRQDISRHRLENWYGLRASAPDIGIPQRSPVPVFTANSPMQHGIAAYLSDPKPYVELPAFYQAKRDRFAAGLAQTPLRALACEGSYFQCASYADISELRDFSERDCCEWMTREIGVTPIPVSAFYSTPTEQQVIRFASPSAIQHWTLRWRVCCDWRRRADPHSAPGRERLHFRLRLPINSSTKWSRRELLLPLSLAALASASVLLLGVRRRIELVVTHDARCRHIGGWARRFRGLWQHTQHDRDYRWQRPVHSQIKRQHAGAGAGHHRRCVVRHRAQECAYCGTSNLDGYRRAGRNVGRRCNGDASDHCFECDPDHPGGQFDLRTGK